MNRRLDNLDELRTYVAIVDCGSLAGAAAALGITPNAVSRRLGALEARLGRRLLHRTTRRLSVTEEGRRFHARCRRLLDEAEEAERELAGVDGLGGTLHVGIHPDLVCPELMFALRRMLEVSAELRLRLRVSPRFIEPIHAGLDLSIHVGRPPPSSLVAVSLGTLVWALAAAPSYAELRGQPRSPEQLAHHDCLRVLRDRPETHWALSRGNGPARRFAIGGRFETTDASALAGALYAGLGIGVRLRSEIDSAVRAGQLVPVLPAWRWASTPLYALLPEGRSKLAGVRAVLDALRATTMRLS